MILIRTRKAATTAIATANTHFALPSTTAMSRVQGKSGAYASSANNTNASISRLWPEPSPNWLEAIKEWRWLWQVHIYGFGSLFLVMALYVGFSLIRDRKKALMGHRTHFTAMDIMLQITGLVRSVILYWDPYLSSEVTSDARTLLFIVSWGVASACITSAFTIMLLIFLETTKTSLGPPRLRNLPFLLGITFANILYLLTSDLVVWFHPSAKLMIFTCHVTFAAWGVTASAGYAVAGYRMRRNLMSSLHIAPHEHKRLTWLFKFVFVSSVFGSCNFCLSIYMASSEYGVLNDMGFVKSWPWFCIQSASRTLELLVCASVLAVASKNTKSREQPISLKISVLPTRQEDVEF